MCTYSVCVCVRVYMYVRTTTTHWPAVNNTIVYMSATATTTTTLGSLGLGILHVLPMDVCVRLVYAW